MDDRLWWFANKIQDVFQIGTYDCPTLLEDFISADPTVEAINLFLNAGGTNRVFVHSSMVDKVTLSNRTLSIYTTLPEKLKLEGHILLYFFRLCNDVKLEVDTIPNNVFAGVVKDSAIQSFTTFLSEVVAPVLKSKRDWGQCSSEQVQQLLSCVDKCVYSMVDSPTPTGKIVLETAPECEDTISRRLENTAPAYLAECERLIQSWSTTIETVLSDAFEDSRSHMLESYTGPMVEIHRWKRRNLLLTSIIEQLKTKESKAVITTLIANKSKYLKKWRSVDIIITDTANEAKDKYKYLEGLKRHIEPLCDENRISEVMNTCLHHLMMGFKQAEAASRHYARSGFLGVIMSKVSNQLVTLCKANLFVRQGYEADEVWGSSNSPANRESLKHLHSALTECLALHKFYKECLRNLRDMLGASNKNTICGSRRGASSVARSDCTDSRDSNVNEKRLRHNRSPNHLHYSYTQNSHDRWKIVKDNVQVFSPKVKPGDRRTGASQTSLFQLNAQNFGIPITDDQAILGSLDKLIERSRELIEVITTLSQLEDLADSVADIGKCGVSPLITKQHLCATNTTSDLSMPPSDSNMDCLMEEEEVSQPASSAEDSAREITPSLESDSGTDGMRSINTEEIGPSTEKTTVDDVHIATFIRSVLNETYQSLISECSSLEVMLSTEGKHKEKFPETYQKFVQSIGRLEITLCAYVKSTITEKISIENGLAVIQRFSALRVSKDKGNLRQTLQDLQADLFLNFEDNLERIKELYEENKDSPPITHNAPTVASALLWIRQLIQKIEDPMKIFRENKLLMSNRDSGRIIKLYNRLATTFYKFETLWLTNWVTTVEPIRSALRATLLIRDSAGNLHVNMDPKILELIQETKWLLRLNCNVPEGAKEVLKQEQRIKTYVQRLKQNVKDMGRVISEILPAVKPVLSSQLHHLQLTIKPGLVTLTWNNVNIDAFLHKMTIATQELSKTNELVQGILESQVEVHLSDIPTLLFYESEGTASRSCQDFVSVQTHLVGERFLELTHMITQVQAGLFNGVMSAINAADRSGYVKRTPDETLVASVLAEFHMRINKSYMSIIKRSVSNLAHSLTEGTPLFKSKIELCVPQIVLTPSLADMQEALNSTLTIITESIERATWLTPTDREMMRGWISEDKELQGNISLIKQAALLAEEEIAEFFSVFMEFKRFWRDDLHGEYKRFMEGNSCLIECANKVQALLEEEHKVLAIDSAKKMKVTVLDTTPVKNSIHAMIRTWKYKYASQLHYNAKRDLEDIIKYRDHIRERLTVSVECLSSLSETLDLLAELGDLENTIDDTYLPVEITYQQLTDFEVQLPRNEVELVATLRDEWKMLMDLADSVRQTLMIEQKLQFEQELEKQVQSFIVEVIQLRTSFESQGPGVSNISPDEAMRRLTKFWKSFNTFDSKQHTLQAVQKMYGLPLTAYPDLEKTGEELNLLQTLYDLYQKYIEFDETFKDTLWQDVNLEQSTTEMKVLHMDCKNLPGRVKEWGAYHTLCDSLEAYLDLFPVLQQLNSKQIRSRHWLQVMQVTGSNFQLEASQMKLCHLLDCDLIKYKTEIGDIVSCASKELDLEQKLRSTEEEWAEQSLHFSQFKNRGFLMLDARYTVNLLEMLEDSQASLASMLTSKYIGPLKDEAASWAAKLLSVSEVIEQWLTVQNHWVHLESVFSLPTTKKDLPQEAKRFASIDKTWTKLMKKSFEIKNVIQCCHGGEPPKTGTLTHLSEQLEFCQRSLTQYLDEKRKLFPRFYYVSDAVLLAILSSHNDVEEVSKHFRAIFQNIDSVLLAPTEEATVDGGDSSALNVISEVSTERNGPDREPVSSPDDFTSFSESPLWSGGPTITAIGAKSAEGEIIDFNREVTMKENVETWLENLLKVTQETISDKVYEVDRDIKNGSSVEDFTITYPCQVALLGFYLQWTRDCELAISENKLDRKALHNLGRKYTNIVARLPTVLNKHQSKLKRAVNVVIFMNHVIPHGGQTHPENNKHIQKPNVREDPVQLVKLENILSLALHLREVAEDFQKKKVRDILDFEWVRNPRYYVDETTIKMMVSDYSMTYGCEYVGCDVNQIITPIRDRFTLLFVHTIQQFTGVSLVAESAVTKHEMAKSLSGMCARFLLTFHCSNGTTYNCISKILTGLAQEGSWGCFSEVSCLALPTLQVLAQCLHLILGNLQQSNKNCTLFSGEQIPLNPNFAVFVTQTTEKYQVDTLPPTLRGLFRLVSVPQPNFGAALRSLCAVLGFKSGKLIADRLIMVHKLVTLQMRHTGVAHMSLNNIHQCLLISAGKRNSLMSNKSHQFGRASSNTTGSNIPTPVSDKRNRAPTPINLTPQIRLEHALVKQTLLESFGLRFVKEDQHMFETILKDVFAGTCDNFAIPRSESTPPPDIRVQFVQQAELAGYETHNSWVTKAMQLYNLSQTYSTLIVAGPSAVGKSALLSTLINTLSYQTPAAHIHKIVRVNPLSVDSLDKIFGHINQNGEWVDGIFTAAWKKANNFRNTSTWLVMDSPLHSSWADMLHSVMQQNRQLTLPNGDRMFMEGNLQLVFETDSLSGVSPAIILPSGMLYMEPEVLGWEPLSNTWLATRTPQDAHVLRLLFSKLAGPLLSYVTDEVTPIVKVCNTGLFRTFINLLTAMLDNFAEVKAESNSEILMERIVLFCLVWSLGGLLPPHQQQPFSDEVKSLTSCLPEYTDNTVYDYYVDEAGEWDSWYNLIPEAMVEQLDHFVENIDTTRTYYLMHLASITNQNILLTGPPATGKTNIVNRFLRAPDKVNYVTKTLVYCENTKPTLFQEVVEHTIVHRQGNNYGARQGKRLCLFVDDMNVLKTHESGTQITNEYLRSLLDMGGIYDNEKAGKWKVIKDMTVIGAMRNPAQGTEKSVAARLLRHFMVFNVPTPTPQTLYQTIDSILQALLVREGGAGLEQTLHNSIVKASCDLLSSLQIVLQQNTVPGRYHYCFNITTIVNIAKGIQRTSDSMRNSPTMMQLLWLHEAERVVSDAICRPDDTQALTKLLAEITVKYFKELSMYEHAKPYFVTFDEYQDISRQLHRQGVSSGSNSAGVPVQVKPVSNLQDIRQVMVRYCQQMTDEAQKQLNSLLLSDVTLEHILKIHRVITMSRGNMLCVGSHGNNLDLLVNLASFISGMELFTVKSTRPQHFFEQARTAFRVAGSEGRQCVLLINSNIAHEEELMEKLNSALLAGEIPFLFTNDEMEGLLQSLQVVIRRDAPELLSDPIQFFSLRVKRNLRIVICIEPGSPYLNTTNAKFKGLLNLCQVSWLMEWQRAALASTCSYYMSSKQASNFTEKETDLLVQVITNIHTSVQSQLAPHPWELIASPASNHKQNTLLECVKLARLQSIPNEGVLVGPKVYQQFLDYFIALYTKKSGAEETKLSVHKEALLTIQSMVESCKKMNEAIVSGEKVLADTQIEVQELLKQLTMKSAALEKIKAQLGCESSLLPSLQALQSQLEDQQDVYEFLEDDYDPKITKEERRARRKVKILQQFEAAKAEEEALTITLNKHKSKLESLLVMLDRNLFDSIRVMPSPPSMVNSIMMIFVKLLQCEKKLPEELPTPVTEEDTAAQAETTRDRRKTKARIKVPPVIKPAEVDKKDKKERDQWLVVQGTLQDSQGIRDSIAGLNWQEGLCSKTVDIVQNLMKRAADDHSEQVLKEVAPPVSMATRRQSIDTGAVVPGIADRSVGKLDEEAVTHASEKVGFIYKFMLALLAYHHAYGPVTIAQEQTQSLAALLKEIEKEEQLAKEAAAQTTSENGVSEEAVANLQVEIKSLQEKYEQAVVKKRSLQTDCQNIREKLRAMSSLTSVLRSQREQWTTVVEQHQSHLTVIANCVLAAAFLAYCGSLVGERRRALFNAIKDACKDLGADGHIIEQDQIVDFIMGETLKYQWTAQLLPREANFMENTMLATHTLIPQWLLIYDSEGISEHWLKTLHGKNEVITISYYSAALKNTLESALSEGKILVVTEADDSLISEDARFKDLISKSADFLVKHDPIKIFVSEKEVVGVPGFKLYIVCNKKPTNHVLITSTRLLNLTPTLDGFTEFFLQHFLAIEKNRLQEDQKKFGQEVSEYTKSSSESEAEILKCLAESRDKLLADTPAIKKLLNMKKHHTEALENLENARNSEANVLKSREVYRPLAVRAAVIYRTSMLMSRINPMYQWSLLQFLPVFESSVKQSDRTTISMLLDQLTSTACLTYIKGTFANDKGIFSLAVLLEIEDSAGNVGPGEREYLVAPISETTAKSLPRSGGPPSSKRKIFEWMTDEQWQNLQVLAHHCSWFSDVFDRMNKDSAEVKWRLLSECDSPETSPLPDVLDQRVTKVQHLMLIRAVRPARFITASLKFASDLIGKKVISDNSIDLGSIVKTMSARTPILLLYRDEPENARFLITDLAYKRQQEVVSLYVGKSGAMELKQCQMIVDKALQAGHWVHLHAVHNCPDIMLSLLVSINGAKVMNSNFRLWLSCEPVDTFPSAVLQSCLKICTDSPRAIEGQSSFMKDGMIRSLSWITPDILGACTRGDWVPLLHNLCLIYNLFQLRGRLAPNGWKYSWTAAELWESLRAAVLVFNEEKVTAPSGASPAPSNPQNRAVSWTALRYLLGEVIYGGQVNDPLDKQVINSMLDHFICPAACKKDYEIPKTKWKLPSCCFQPLRSNQISQIVSQIENHPPPETFEACLMHTISDNHAPGEKYFFSQLAQIYEIETKEAEVEIPVSSGTPIRGSANSATIKSRDRSPLSVKTGKDIDLIETANILLQKLPKGWHKDYVMERLKKLGGSVAYTYFMSNEMSAMQSILEEIRATLSAIKTSVDQPTINSPTVISVAHDLLYQRVPRHWQNLAGSISPNPTNTLTWMGDIVQRCSHLERALQGRERVPCLWISIFSSPEGLLGTIMHEAVQTFDGAANTFEVFNFQTEITNRDKDHIQIQFQQYNSHSIRESPHEGMFVYGISLYGASWERTINEMQDVAPKSKFTQLPVIHVTAGPSQTDRTHCLYQCPVYSTRAMDDKPLFYLDIFNENVHYSKWALRGLCCCMR